MTEQQINPEDGGVEAPPLDLSNADEDALAEAAAAAEEMFADEGDG